MDRRRARRARAAIESVDCLILNDAELRQLTGKPNLVSAAREILSWAPAPRPAAWSSPSRASTARRSSRARASSRCPPTRWRASIDPTGAGDTFAGGLVGYIAAHPDEPLSDELLRRAMAHATVLASFNVEEFGTERMQRLTGDGDRQRA